MPDENNNPTQTDRLVHALAAKTIPGVFQEGFQNKYPDFILAQGRGNGYYNAMYEMEQRQFGTARAAAVQSDAAHAANTIVGMFITAARLAGKELTEEQMAKVKECAAFNGANIEAYCTLARSFGINENAINYMRNLFYGDKGSTANMFDTTYNVMKSRIGSGAALSQARNLAQYQFGKHFSREFTGGLNADEFAATRAFMVENGAFAGQDLRTLDNGLIDDSFTSNYMMTHKEEDPADSYAMVRALKYDKRTLLGRNNERAVRMMSSAYLDRLKQMNYSELREEVGGALTEEANSALEKLHEFDQVMGKIKKDYRLKVDKNEKDANKAKADLQKQLEENIQKAKDANDEEAVRQLEEFGKKAVEMSEDLFKDTGVKNKKGEAMNVFQLGDATSAKLATVADRRIRQLNETWEALDMRQSKLETELFELQEKDPSNTTRINALKKQLDAISLEKGKLKNTSDAGEIVASGHSREAMDSKARTAAVGSTAKSIQAAMAASGKPITVQEALQASKAIMPMNTDTRAMTRLGEVISTSLAGVMDRNGSVEQFLLQMASGRNIAKQYGLTEEQGTLVASAGTNVNKYGALNGLTDEAMRGVADNFVKDISKHSKTAITASVGAMLAKDSANNGVMQKIDSSSLSDEQKQHAKELMSKAEMDPDNFSDEDASNLRHYLNTAGVTRDQDYRPTSNMARMASTAQAEVFKRAGVGSARIQSETDWFESSGAANVIKLGSSDQDKEQKRRLAAFFRKGGMRMTNIARAENSAKAKQEWNQFIKEKEDSGEIDAETAKILREQGLAAAKAIDDKSNLNNAAAWKADQETRENFARDEQLNAASARVQAVFDPTDKNSMGKIIDIVGSDAYKRASDSQRVKMITEGFGHQMNTYEKQALAYQLARTGKLAVGSSYTDAAGKTQRLTAGQREIGQLALNDPEKFKALREKAAKDGTVQIGGVGYTAEALDTSVYAYQQAAFKATGMTAEEVKRNPMDMTRMHDKEYADTVFKDADVKAARREQIRKTVERNVDLVKNGYRNDALADLAGMDKGSEEYNQRLDEIVSKYEDNADSAKETYGLMDEESEHFKNVQHKVQFNKEADEKNNSFGHQAAKFLTFGLWGDYEKYQDVEDDSEVLASDTEWAKEKGGAHSAGVANEKIVSNQQEILKAVQDANALLKKIDGGMNRS